MQNYKQMKDKPITVRPDNFFFLALIIYNKKDIGFSKFLMSQIQTVPGGPYEQQSENE